MTGVTLSLARRLRDRIIRREADVFIGGREDPYMIRWHVIPRNRWFNIYLHHFLRSDDDRALHDHPWWNLSFLIEGKYAEVTQSHVTIRRAGDWAWRRAIASHRIALFIRTSSGSEDIRYLSSRRDPAKPEPCWTFFVTGPKVRDWGFICRRGWVHWKEFTNPADGGQTIGRGCGEDDLPPSRAHFAAEHGDMQ